MRRAAALVMVVAFGLLATVADGGTAWARAKSKGKGKSKKRPTPGLSADAEGRRHLKKANALAARDNCEAAIEEYSIAFERLSDPAVLLARAECRRRVGQNAEALADYRAYLDLSPDLPNRADIDSKIAALEALPTRDQAASPKQPAPPKEARPPKEAPSREPPAPVAKEPPTRERAPVAAPPPTRERAPVAAAPAPLPAPPAPLAVEPAPAAVTVVQPSAGTDSAPPSGRHTWLWVTLGALVVGGAAAGGYVFLRPSDPAPPSTPLGNYHF